MVHSSPYDDALDEALSRLMSGSYGRTSRQASAQFSLFPSLTKRLRDSGLIESSLGRVEATVDHLNAFKIAIDRKLLALSRDRNSLLPINKLPTELLIAIFNDVSRDCDGMLVDDRLRLLSSVQARWRQQITECPSFWTHVKVEDPILWTELKLQRSRGATLDVDFTGDADDDQSTAFLSLILPQSGRWRELWSTRTNGLDHLLPFLPKDTPTLEVLELETEGPQRIVPFVGGVQLRQLELINVAFDDWSVLPAALTRLDLKNITVAPTFPSHLFKVLRDCPMLNTLNLDQLTLHGPEESVSSFPIQLPHLTELQLGDIPFQLAIAFQNHVQADNVNDFLLAHEGVGAEQLLAELVRPRQGGRSRLDQIFANARIDRVSAEIVDRQLHVEASGKHCVMIHIILDVPQAAFLRTAPRLPFAGTSYAGQLSLFWGDRQDGNSHDDEDQLTATDIVSIFPDTLHLSLVFKTRVGRVTEALEYLSKSLADPEKWPFPKLKTLSFFSGGATARHPHRTRILADMAGMMIKRRASGVLPDVKICGLSKQESAVLEAILVSKGSGGSFTIS